MKDDISILKPAEVLKLTTWSTSGLRRQVLEGLFPPALNLGARSTGYITEEVQAVLTARSIGMSDDELKEIVERLVKYRKLRASRLLDVIAA
ncbi:AlpA family phage regulatory protein [Alteromonas ponticola]|uniref:AlpA family phage regulatory protein n=1 Tax=Alteromonas aquimaris TaxID=2998417 RepID=A0ABT3P5S0_9ALTE|nr:AlpA family phage regulatory protein [Alteromonas aquimaris]MCW8108079.1 AlpA family phage regulatory protein [Alteromonas aquimaris]